MQKRSSKDENQLAKSIVDEIIKETKSDGWCTTLHKKNPAAVALGKLGGLKGGKARAAALTPERRREIAQKAAKSRWKK
ncbi:MAG: hypothetical protein WBD27_18990 [Pyrinomonadaceae bacterium]